MNVRFEAAGANNVQLMKQSLACAAGFDEREEVE
jgi:hypothetical protein